MTLLAYRHAARQGTIQKIGRGFQQPAGGSAKCAMSQCKGQPSERDVCARPLLQLQWRQEGARPRVCFRAGVLAVDAVQLGAGPQETLCVWGWVGVMAPPVGCSKLVGGGRMAPPENGRGARG